jgi:hypothetical protein
VSASLVATVLFSGFQSINTLAYSDVNSREALEKMTVMKPGKSFENTVTKEKIEDLKSNLNLHPYSFNKNFSLKSKSFSSTAPVDEYDIEDESVNNDFKGNTNKITLDKTMIGQLIPFGDVDIYPMTIPDKGYVVLAGMASSYNINLIFGLFNKNFAENNNLKLVEITEQDGVPIQIYQINKAGTYYAIASDYDFSTNVNIDNNTEEDAYALFASFVDTNPPASPTVNAIDDNDKIITGKAEALSTVIIKNGSKTMGSPKADKNGNFKLSISPIRAGTKITLAAKDRSNNISKAITTTVLDKTPPKTLTVNKVTSKSKYVGGKTEANATVTIKHGKTTLGSKKADSKGNYKVNIKSQKKNTNLTIYSADAAKNTKSIITKVK